MDAQLYLTIILLIIEVIAFAWLILDNVKSKKNQDQIIQLERQILQLEESIMASESKILDEISDLVKMLKEKKK